MPRTASSSRATPKGKDDVSTDILLSSARRSTLRSSSRPQNKKKVEVVSSESGSEDASEFGGGSSSSESEEEEIEDDKADLPVATSKDTADLPVITTAGAALAATQEDEDEEDHFETPVKVVQRNKRVIESDSSALSEVEEPTDSDALENLQPVAKKAARKKAPKKPKFDFLGGHPELRTVWEDLEGTQEAIDIPAIQPTEILIKLLPFQLTGLSWMQRQELSRFNGGILADQSTLNYD
jgi:DNA repair protein RAD16